MTDYGMMLYRELQHGTFEQLLLTPLKVRELLIGSILYGVMISILSSLGSLFIVSAIFGYLHYLFSIEFLLGLFLVAMGFIPVLGLSLCFGALVLKIKEPWSVFNVLTTLLLSISGVFYPLSVLPYTVRLFAALFPPTIQIGDMRAIVLGIEWVFCPKIDLLLLASYCLIWPGLGLFLFKGVKTELKKKGKVGLH